MVHRTWLVLVIFCVARFSRMNGKPLVSSKPRKWLNEREVYQGWSAWGSWSVCSEKTCCRHGVMVRRRYCGKAPCTGIESEGDDCPRRNCQECSAGPLADSVLAATGSFINMECKTTRKYSTSGKFSFCLRPIYREYPTLKKALHRSFFGVQKMFELDGRAKKMKRVYKFCFEPKHLTSRQARQMFQTSRRVKLFYPVYSPGPTRVDAILITVLPSGELFRPGIYFTAIERSRLMAFYRYK